MQLKAHFTAPQTAVSSGFTKYGQMHTFKYMLCFCKLKTMHYVPSTLALIAAFMLVCRSSPGQCTEEISFQLSASLYEKFSQHQVTFGQLSDMMLGLCLYCPLGVNNNSLQKSIRSYVN